MEETFTTIIDGKEYVILCDWMSRFKEYRTEAWRGGKFVDTASNKKSSDQAIIELVKKIELKTSKR